MDKEIVVFLFEFIACILVVYGVSMIFIPASIIIGGILLFMFVQSVESYLDEKEEARQKTAREGRLDFDGWI